MKKSRLIFLFLLALGTFLLPDALMCQSPSAPVLYLLPGTSGDSRLFSYLQLKGWETSVIEIPVPHRGETMSQLAQRLLPQVDRTRPHAFAGVSVGGMVAVEMAKESEPLAVLLISSAKQRSELPLRYRIQKYLPLYAWVPPRQYARLNNWARPIFEPDSKPFDDLFAAMVKDKDPMFIPGVLHAIMNWDNEQVPAHLHHLHGTKDHTLPIKCIGEADRVKGGSHMMVVTRAEEVSRWMQAKLDAVVRSE